MVDPRDRSARGLVMRKRMPQPQPLPEGIEILEETPEQILEKQKFQERIEDLEKKLEKQRFDIQSRSEMLMKEGKSTGGDQMLNVLSREEQKTSTELQVLRNSASQEEAQARLHIHQRQQVQEQIRQQQKNEPITTKSRVLVSQDSTQGVPQYIVQHPLERQSRLATPSENIFFTGAMNAQSRADAQAQSVKPTFIEKIQNPFGEKVESEGNFLSGYTTTYRDTSTGEEIKIKAGYPLQIFPAISPKVIKMKTNFGGASTSIKGNQIYTQVRYTTNRGQVGSQEVVSDIVGSGKNVQLANTQSQGVIAKYGLDFRGNIKLSNVKVTGTSGSSSSISGTGDVLTGTISRSSGTSGSTNVNQFFGTGTNVDDYIGVGARIGTNNVGINRNVVFTDKGYNIAKGIDISTKSKPINYFSAEGSTINVGDATLKRLASQQTMIAQETASASALSSNTGVTTSTLFPSTISSGVVGSTTLLENKGVTKTTKNVLSTPLLKNSSKVLQKTSLLTSQKSKNSQKSVLKTIQKSQQEPKSILKFASALDVLSKQRGITTQNLFFRTTTAQGSKFVLSPFFPRLPIPRTPIIPPKQKEEHEKLIKAMKKLGKSNVDVEVGMKMKKKKVIGKNLPKWKALKKAQDYVDNNIEASFILKKSKGNTNKKDIKPFVPSNKFRASKTNPLYRVEKRKYRLDSPREIKQLNMFKGKVPKDFFPKPKKKRRRKKK